MAQISAGNHFSVIPEKSLSLFKTESDQNYEHIKVSATKSIFWLFPPTSNLICSYGPMIIHYRTYSVLNHEIVQKYICFFSAFCKETLTQQ